MVHTKKKLHNDLVSNVIFNDLSTNKSIRSPESKKSTYKRRCDPGHKVTLLLNFLDKGPRLHHNLLTASVTVLLSGTLVFRKRT